MLHFTQQTVVHADDTHDTVSIRVGTSHVDVPWHDMLEILNCNALRRKLTHRKRKAEAEACNIDDRRDVYCQHRENGDTVVEALLKSQQRRA